MTEGRGARHAIDARALTYFPRTKHLFFFLYHNQVPPSTLQLICCYHHAQFKIKSASTMYWNHFVPVTLSCRDRLLSDRTVNPSIFSGKEASLFSTNGGWRGGVGYGLATENHGPLTAVDHLCSRTLQTKEGKESSYSSLH